MGEQPDTPMLPNEVDEEGNDDAQIYTGLSTTGQADQQQGRCACIDRLCLVRFSFLALLFLTNKIMHSLQFIASIAPV